MPREIGHTEKVNGKMEEIVPRHVFHRRSTVTSSSPLRTISQSNDVVLKRTLSRSLDRRRKFQKPGSKTFDGESMRSKSEGCGDNIHIDTATAIVQATKASMQKSESRRICWTLSRKNGINISVQDLRNRSTKVVLLGKENVGKTAFVVRFVTRRFISEYINDRHTCYEHNAVYSNGDNQPFEILDLSNPVLQLAQDEKTEKNFENQIKWGDVFMLMYSTVDRPSFNEISRLAFLINFLHKCSAAKPIVTLVGTKTDLVEQRTVTSLEGRRLAESLGARFYEVSSREGYKKIEDAFRESADLSRFSLIQTPLLVRRASGTTSVFPSPSHTNLTTFRSSTMAGFL